MVEILLGDSPLMLIWRLLSHTLELFHQILVHLLLYVILTCLHRLVHFEALDVWEHQGGFVTAFCQIFLHLKLPVDFVFDHLFAEL